MGLAEGLAASRSRTRFRRGVWGALRRLVLSFVISVGVIRLATLALFVTSWPAWLSLSLEPFSLLLTPGVLGALIFTRAHDYTAQSVVLSNFVFYFPVLFGMLWWLDRRARSREAAERAPGRRRGRRFNIHRRFK